MVAYIRYVMGVAGIAIPAVYHDTLGYKLDRWRAPSITDITEVSPDLSARYPSGKSKSLSAVSYFRTKRLADQTDLINHICDNPGYGLDHISEGLPDKVKSVLCLANDTLECGRRHSRSSPAKIDVFLRALKDNQPEIKESNKQSHGAVNLQTTFTILYAARELLGYVDHGQYWLGGCSTVWRDWKAAVPKESIDNLVQGLTFVYDNTPGAKYNKSAVEVMLYRLFGKRSAECKVIECHKYEDELKNAISGVLDAIPRYPYERLALNLGVPGSMVKWFSNGIPRFLLIWIAVMCCFGAGYGASMLVENWGAEAWASNICGTIVGCNALVLCASYDCQYY